MARVTRPIPTVDELQKYRANVPGRLEGIRQTLYDSQNYAAAGQQVLTFFQTPVGSGTKTKADTNMTSAGQLPAPQMFLVESIELHFFPGVLITQSGAVPQVGTKYSDDVLAFAKNGFLDFFLSSKSYLTEAPLGKFPPKTRLDGMGFSSAATTVAAQSGTLTVEYACMSGRPYYLDPPQLIEPNMNFNVTLNWPAAVALPSGQIAKVFCVFDGIFYRASQ